MNRRRQCLSEGDLRTLVDGAARSADATAWEAHLAACEACRARLARVRADADAAAELLTRLESDATPDLTRAYQRFQAARTRPPIVTSKGVPLMHRLFGAPQRALAFGATLVALMVLVIAVSPVGTLAQDVLNSFRVQQFAAITIPMDMVQQFSGLEEQARNLTPEEKQEIASGLQGLSLSGLDTNLSPDSVRQATSLDEARAHLGGTLLAPETLPQAFDGVEPQIYVGDPAHIEYTFDVAAVQSILGTISMKPTGLPDPAETPRATVSLDVYPSAVMLYQAGDQRLVVGQTESPVLNIPSEIDVEQMRDAILSIPGLPSDLVAQLRAVNDWQHTLIIPVPAGATTSQKKVDGAPALLIEAEEGAAVLWQKDGVLYFVGGHQVSGSDVMAAANSMD